MSDTTFTVAVGDILPALERTTGLANWNRYAAVNYEFVDIHMDDDAGKAAGYESAFGMGNLMWSYMHSLLRTWLGDHGQIVRMKCQFRSPNTKGMTVSAQGKVTEIRDLADAREIDLELWINDQNGKTLVPGSATVVVRS